MESRNRDYAVEPIMEKQVVLFLDFLGFADASRRMDERVQSDVLGLLKIIADLRSEFSITTTDFDDGSKSHLLKPTVSTFSDHIVISYPISRLNGEFGATSSLMILSQIHDYATIIALMALKIGFLIRGGVSVGNLYHSGGVVFGEAMVDAYNLESKMAVYPRIVVSEALRDAGAMNGSWVRRDFDGLLIVDFYTHMFLKSAQPGDGYRDAARAWKEEAITILRDNVARLTAANNVAALSKWVWFAKQIRQALSAINPEIPKMFGYSDSDLSWLKL